MRNITFQVEGRPQQRGSKHAIARKGGGTPIMLDDNKRNGPWMDAVAFRASEAMDGTPLLRGPLRVNATFRFKRIGDHYHKRKSGDVLRDDAPHHHCSQPDIDKLLRAINDAMTGVVYRDDKQIAQVQVAKEYTESSEGVSISVWEIPGALHDGELGKGEG